MLISRWLRDMVRDLFHSLRAMLCSAWSTAFAILLAAIVIGFTSAVLSLAKTRFLNPFQDPGKLVLISKRGPNGEDKGTQAEYYSDLYTENKSFSDLAGWSRYSRAGLQSCQQVLR